MAGKIYIGQPVALTLDCKTSLAGAAALAVLALKPDGSTTTTWPATASGATTMLYQVPQGALDQSGDWIIHAMVTFGAETTPGEMIVLTVHELYT